MGIIQLINSPCMQLCKGIQGQIRVSEQLMKICGRLQHDARTTGRWVLIQVQINLCRCRAMQSLHAIWRVNVFCKPHPAEGIITQSHTLFKPVCQLELLLPPKYSTSIHLWIRYTCFNLCMNKYTTQHALPSTMSMQRVCLVVKGPARDSQLVGILRRLIITKGVAPTNVSTQAVSWLTCLAKNPPC